MFDQHQHLCIRQAKLLSAGYSKYHFLVVVKVHSHVMFIAYVNVPCEWTLIAALEARGAIPF